MYKSLYIGFENDSIFKNDTYLIDNYSFFIQMSEHRLLIDKHVPRTFEEITFNHPVAEQLQNFAQAVDAPHIILQGAEGSGRRTFALLYLQTKYHLEHIKVRHQSIGIKTTNKMAELQMLYSDYHYQIDPSIHTVHDRLIIQTFIKNILQTKPYNAPYHTIIISNADKLTFEAQQSLRRTLEKSAKNCRFIFLVNQESTMIDPLMSRCVRFRLSSPTEQEICETLKKIVVAEKIAFLDEQIQQIAQYSKRNLLKAINTLQFLHLNDPTYLSKRSLIRFDTINTVDIYLSDLIECLIGIKDASGVLQIRERLYDLLVQCVDPVRLLKNIFEGLFEHVKKHAPEKGHKLVQILSKYENTLRQGSKPVYHIEGFCMSVIVLLNNV
jgi:replication factor C subunit 3/5